MSEAEEQPFFLWTMFQQLRRRGFALGPAEYEAVREALGAGFGWSSRRELLEVCSALWAKSREERAVVAAIFDQHVVADWSVGGPAAAPASGQPETEMGTVEQPAMETNSLLVPPADSEIQAPAAPATAPTGRLPPLRVGEMPALPYAHVFLPQYPVSFRTVAQAWRRLRWPVREGPATELDVDATVQRRSRQGVASAPVLRPRRRNRAKLLLLVDRQGSMTPFHSYVDDVCEAICQAGRLRQVGQFYFHDTPLEGADPSIVEPLRDGLFPSLDAVLAEIPALTKGDLLARKDLSSPRPAAEVVAEYGQAAALVILSDGGAARGRYDLLRLLDTVAFLKGVKQWTGRVVWLNPLPVEAWTGSTAAQLARHVPMFPMDRDGMHRAVNVLRGQPYTVEKPLLAGARVA